MGLRPLLESLHRRSPKEERDGHSEPGSSIPQWCGELDPTWQLHTPAPAKSPPHQHPGCQQSRPRCKVGVPCGWYLSGMELAGWPWGVVAQEPDLLGFLGTERAGQGQLSTLPTSLARGINSIKEVIRKNAGSPSSLQKLPQGCPLALADRDEPKNLSGESRGWAQLGPPNALATQLAPPPLLVSLLVLLSRAFGVLHPFRVAAGKIQPLLVLLLPIRILLLLGSGGLWRKDSGVTGLGQNSAGHLVAASQGGEMAGGMLSPWRGHTLIYENEPLVSPGITWQNWVTVAATQHIPVRD